MQGVGREPRPRILVAALVSACLCGGSCAKSSPPRESPSLPIVLAGAEYLASLLRAEVLAFRSLYPASDSIRIDANGSAEGMEQLVNGDVSMSVLLRELTDPEVNAAVQRDGLQTFPVAWDAVAVIVHPSAPVEQISRTELAGVYSGAITRWDALGWRRGGEILALTAGPRLGLFGYLEQALLGEGSYAETVVAPPSEAEIVNIVATRPNAIGCVSRPFAETARVRTLRVAQAKGLPYVELTRETVLRRSYPLLRSISLATPARPRPTASDLITFMSGVDGQAIVARHGYAPATVPIRIVRTAEEAQ